MQPLFSENIEEIERSLGYIFTNKSLLQQALTHKSYANENKQRSDSYNERLELLGDAVLELVVCEYLYQTYVDSSEAELTKIKSYAVKESTLAQVSKALELGKFLFVGKGEEATCGRQKPSILADAFEAVIAAVYLDGGFAAVKKVVLSCLEKHIHHLVKQKLIYNYKTEVQEFVQTHFGVLPKYEFHGEEGPDHNKTFDVTLYVKDEIFGTGRGKNKKEATQMAASVALARLKTIFGNP
jgi:ribonuclease-3